MLIKKFMILKGMSTIEYEILTVDEAPDEIKVWFEKNKKDRKNYNITYEGKTYVIQTLGEKNTGGYGIELSSIHEEESNIIIDYNDIYPKKDNLVTQIINYPYIIVEIEQTQKNIITSMHKNNS